jgi:hypothetical protein
MNMPTLESIFHESPHRKDEIFTLLSIHRAVGARSFGERAPAAVVAAAGELSVAPVHAPLQEDERGVDGEPTS